MIKFAEVTGTHLMPLSKKPTAPSFTAVKKANDGALPVNTEVTDKAPAQSPQLRVLHPHVDVSKRERLKEPEPVKRAQHYALRDRYPLDSYDQVKMASAYFDQWHKDMPLDDRREYALNMVKRATALNIPVSDIAQVYGSTKKASAEHLEMILDMRKGLTGSATDKAVLSKIASIASTLPGDYLAQAISAFDKKAGLDKLYARSLPDPYQSVFGEKVASFSEVIDNTVVTEERLKALAKVGRQWVAKMFGEDMSVEFMEDPVGIYQSLPTEQRKMLGRLAEKVEAEGTI